MLGYLLAFEKDSILQRQKGYRDFKSRDLKTLSKRVSRVKRDPTEIRALPRPIVSAGPLYCSREKRLAYIARETAKRKRRPPLSRVAVSVLQ